MPKGKIDPQEYEVKKYEKSQLQVVKEVLEEFIGKEVRISSNLERAKGDTKKVLTIYHVGQRYNELGQVLTLENPSLAPEDLPQIPVSPNIQVTKEPNRVIIRYPREVSFKALRRQTLPDLEIYIEEVVKKT